MTPTWTCCASTRSWCVAPFIHLPCVLFTAVVLPWMICDATTTPFFILLTATQQPLRSQAGITGHGQVCLAVRVCISHLNNTASRLHVYVQPQPQQFDKGQNAEDMPFAVSLSDRFDRQCAPLWGWVVGTHIRVPQCTIALCSVPRYMHDSKPFLCVLHALHINTAEDDTTFCVVLLFT